MPRPMLKQPQTQTQAETILSATRQQSNQKQAQQMDKMKLDRLLRRPRSKAYMDAMCKLDAGGHAHNQHKVDDIINAIRNELPEVDLCDVMLGCVSICYLGEPYEVHTLDITGEIIRHYQVGQPLPGRLEKARALALRGGYSFIEVYSDCCRCVSANGSVAVVNG